MEIPTHTVVRDDVDFGEGCTLGHFSIIGAKSPYLPRRVSSKVSVGDDCFIGSHATIYEGVTLGDDCYISDYGRIDRAATVGSNTKLVYGGRISGESTVGENCIIGESVCEHGIVGDGTQMLGRMGHIHHRPDREWDILEEEAPVVEESSFAGIGSKIIGDITVGSQAYVAANAIITRDVPSKSIGFGVNNIVHHEEWDGELANSAFFE